MEQLKHYQQGFLPLHEQLWDKALVDFRWLDKQGQVQQTRFSDGWILSAYFSAPPF
ncbi:glycoside hydrolase [Vibrio cholerae]|uniref:glycoside hydrolase n=1 Tax=Vibrio cholerae TaxID=666 RepID=UPI003CC5DC53